MEGGATDGKFLVRPRGSSEYVLSVVFKGKPTHHLVKRDGGELMLNGGKFGGHTEIESLIGALDRVQQGWPVALVGGGGGGGGGSGSGRKLSRSASASSGGSTKKEWLHGAMGKEEAGKLLMDTHSDDGCFFVRKRGAEHPNDYVMCVIFKGKPTHHLISRDGAGSPFTINGKDTGATNLGGLVKKLRSRQPFWCGAHP